MIVNKSKNIVIANEHKVCDNIFTRMRGLMFHKRIDDYGLVFVFNKDVMASIHMLFVFFSIDILWLDHEKRVVEMKRSIAPFTPHISPKNRCRYFIEVQKGTIEEKGIEVGDLIEW